jgi:hypothetical protein
MLDPNETARQEAARDRRNRYGAALSLLDTEAAYLVNARIDEEQRQAPNLETVRRIDTAWRQITAALDCLTCNSLE